jgi:hypothetical protein
MGLLSTRSAQFHNNVMHQNRYIEPDSLDEAEDAQALLKACHISDVHRHSPVVDVHGNVGERVAQPRLGGIRDDLCCTGGDKAGSRQQRNHNLRDDERAASTRGATLSPKQKHLRERS